MKALPVTAGLFLMAAGGVNDAGSKQLRRSFRPAKRGGKRA
jgi:hypothetical protein